MSVKIIDKAKGGKKFVEALFKDVFVPFLSFDFLKALKTNKTKINKYEQKNNTLLNSSQFRRMGNGDKPELTKLP